MLRNSVQFCCKRKKERNKERKTKRKKERKTKRKKEKRKTYGTIYLIIMT
jgi:hypothetical protein